MTVLTFSVPRRADRLAHVVRNGHALCGGSCEAVTDETPEDICERCSLWHTGWMVYRYFDAAGRLLYVGRTGDALGRMLAHSKNSPWWPQVVSHVHTPFVSFREAHAEELRAIREEAPAHNAIRYRARPA